ncbi:hypothetical protein MJO28_011826 [Puccinia striiformis f. sp. tritici]|uniref:Uncharacterized protein n=1 Tax=Puccinia striiformis f. sp. tritici TaxID=168172 RepID=A0ACC0E566_9BASI|nr:hypothetical protein MJO28_011826 [Puccinia striiformis f. sp. tritici]
MNNKKASAYGAPAAGTDFRKTWDKAEYEAKAKQRDEEERERMKEADEALQKGKKPRRKQVDLPKPTELMKQREAPLELNKNQNKTMINFKRLFILPGPPELLISSAGAWSKNSSCQIDDRPSKG